MKTEILTTLMTAYKDDLTQEDKINISNKLKESDDSVAEKVIQTQTKIPFVTLLLGLISGYFGLDRFYLNKVGSGFAKLLLSSFSTILFVAIMSIESAAKGTISQSGEYDSLVFLFLLSAFVSCVWWLVDVVRLYGYTKTENGKKIKEALGIYTAK